MSSEILQIHALSLDQLKKMESVDTRGDLALEKSKEMFLIQTYLCLRISDLVRLDLNCFSRDSHGDLNFSILTEKSPTLVEFNISDLHLDESGKSKPERLIQKYITLHSKAINAPRGLVSFFSKYQYNKNLKILADLAKIDYSKPLASHDARRTGISVLINDFCLNPVTVQKMAGHRKLETTMRYLKHEKTEINNSLKRVDWT